MKKSGMEDSIGELTEEQVLRLAKFGKDVLSIAGACDLSRQLVNVSVSVLTSDYAELGSLKEELATVLRIANLAAELNDECWYLGKTLYGLVGVDYDNNRFNLGETIDIKCV